MSPFCEVAAVRASRKPRHPQKGHLHDLDRGFTEARRGFPLRRALHAAADRPIVAVAATAGALARRINARVLPAAGALCAAAGLGQMALFHHSVPQLVLGGIPFGIGMGTVAAPAPITVIQAVSPSEQALGNGIQGMAQGIVTTVVTQLTFAVLAQNGRVLQGTRFYLDAGCTNAFWLAAGFTVAGLPAVLLIPEVGRLDEAEVGQTAT